MRITRARSDQPGLTVLPAPRARKAQSEPPVPPVMESPARQASEAPPVPPALKAKLAHPARQGQLPLVPLAQQAPSVPPALREQSEEPESKRSEERRGGEE